MKYFKNQNNDVFAYESDGSQDTFIKPDLVLMSQAEIDAHLNPPVIPPTPAEQLAASDADMARVIDDLVSTLIAKGDITESDLPKAAQDKLNNRKALRAQL